MMPDWGDLNPSPHNNVPSGTSIALIPETGVGIAHSMTIRNTPVDIMAGKRKRIVGDGQGKNYEFTAGMEFTYRVEDQVEIGGVVKKPVTIDSIGTAVVPNAPGLLSDPKAICDAYAQTAITQFQSVQSLTDCTFLPPVWSGDPQHHYNWCMEAENYKLTDAGTALREQQIKACTGN